MNDTQHQPGYTTPVRSQLVWPKMWSQDWWIVVGIIVGLISFLMFLIVASGSSGNACSDPNSQKCQDKIYHDYQQHRKP